MSPQMQHKFRKQLGQPHTFMNKQRNKEGKVK